MIVRQSRLSSAEDPVDFDQLLEHQPQLILVFGAVSLLTSPRMEALRQRAPNALLAGCSTAGEIHGTDVTDDTISLTAITFQSGRVNVHEAEAPDMLDSRACGERLGESIDVGDLRGVLVFAPGVDLNGSELIEGIRSRLPSETSITGGLAGDGTSFVSTLTIGPKGSRPRSAVAISFHGAFLRVAHGSYGGWSPFGPARKVTRCVGNVLYELDGRPALALYKEYLGEYASGLPGTGLLFPFEMLDRANAPHGLIRTILAIDEAAGSLTLAGDLDPEGHLRLMHSSAEDLADGAESAAREAKARFGGRGESLGILVSCVGRKLVMGDRVDDEIQGVASVLGSEARLTGFYSYGEIAPMSNTLGCKLHNQTMTITWIGED